jgi:hypothetical protein
MEAADGVPASSVRNMLKIRKTIESAGVEFIHQNGGGPGVRLKGRMAD